MIKEATKWIGYLEHKSNDRLESFTENIGKGGYTIFPMIICRHYPRLNFSGLPWCTVFVCAVCIMYYGKNDAYRALGKPCAGSRLLARRMRRKGLLESSTYCPTTNDLVFLYNDKNRIGHCGIVERVEDGYLFTIEGNTKDPSGHFAQNEGGAVARRKRSLEDKLIACYARTSEILH